MIIFGKRQWSVRFSLSWNKFKFNGDDCRARATFHLNGIKFTCRWWIYISVEWHEWRTKTKWCVKWWICVLPFFFLFLLLLSLIFKYLLKMNTYYVCRNCRIPKIQIYKQHCDDWRLFVCNLFRLFLLCVRRLSFTQFFLRIKNDTIKYDMNKNKPNKKKKTNSRKKTKIKNEISTYGISVVAGRSVDVDIDDNSFGIVSTTLSFSTSFLAIGSPSMVTNADFVDNIVGGGTTSSLVLVLSLFDLFGSSDTKLTLLSKTGTSSFRGKISKWSLLSVSLFSGIIPFVWMVSAVTTFCSASMISDDNMVVRKQLKINFKKKEEEIKLQFGI